MNAGATCHLQVMDQMSDALLTAYAEEEDALLGAAETVTEPDRKKYAAVASLVNRMLADTLRSRAAHVEPALCDTTKPCTYAKGTYKLYSNAAPDSEPLSPNKQSMPMSLSLAASGSMHEGITRLPRSCVYADLARYGKVFADLTRDERPAHDPGHLYQQEYRNDPEVQSQE